jgi:GNAT superfamily N-acetyltransferase
LKITTARVGHSPEVKLPPLRRLKDLSTMLCRIKQGIPLLRILSYQFRLEINHDRSRVSMTHSLNTSPEIRVEEWRRDASQVASIDAEIDMLAEVLHAVVHANAGVSFFTPFSIEEARAFWVDKVLPDMHAGRRRVVIARLDERERAKGEGKRSTGKGEERSERILGTVQLELEMPPNQQHRAAVAKLLVHPAAWRRGIGRALMLALEEIARSEGRSLLTLDTVSGSSAEFLYRSLDFIAVGVIPRYARGALTRELEGTTIMYKELTPATGQP